MWFQGQCVMAAVGPFAAGFPSRSVGASGILLALVMAWNTGVWANEPIEGLISQLGAEQYAQRESASRSLAAAGRAALEPLRHAAEGDDLEIASRAIDLLRGLMTADDAELAADAEASLEQIVERRDDASARLASGALEFHHAGQAEAARRELEALGAIFDERGPWGLRIEIGQQWQGDNKALRLLTRLPMVPHVSFFGTRLTEAEAAVLPRLRGVERVDLYGTGLDDATIERISARLPGIEIDVRKGGKLGVAGAPLIGPCAITHVQPGSAAEQAGLQVGDVVTRFNGIAVENFESLTQAVGLHGPGEKVLLMIDREGPGGKPLRLEKTVELGGW